MKAVQLTKTGTLWHVFCEVAGPDDTKVVKVKRVYAKAGATEDEVLAAQDEAENGVRDPERRKKLEEAAAIVDAEAEAYRRIIQEAPVVKQLHLTQCLSLYAALRADGFPKNKALDASGMTEASLKAAAQWVTWVNKTLIASRRLPETKNHWPKVPGVIKKFFSRF